MNGIQAKSDYSYRERLAHANALGLALQIDMAQWFTPTADNFFLKVSKSRIVGALAEAGTPLMVDSASLKKVDLAQRAEKAIRNTGWLPEPLRVPVAPDEVRCDADRGEAEALTVADHAA